MLFVILSIEFWSAVLIAGLKGSVFASWFESLCGPFFASMRVVMFCLLVHLGGCDVFSSCFVHVFNGGLCLLGDVRVSIYDLCDGDSGFGRQV